MRVVILGATGNIGQQAIDVVKELKHQLVGISFFSNSTKAQRIMSDFPSLNVYSPKNRKTSTCWSYKSLIKKSKPDIVLNAISGFAGLKPSLVCIKLKKTLAIANKESIVVAGKQLISLAKKLNVRIIPVDSEHAAIHELINTLGQPMEILLTGSGGPFYGFSNEQLQNITVEQAINHPRWKMGKKISVDSATHMNKCFEMIEASTLFSTKMINVLYHPQAIIHSVIKTPTGLFGIESEPSMVNPIKYALSGCQENVQGKLVRCDNPSTLYQLEPFEKSILPMIWPAKIISSDDQAAAIILNAANEIAVEWFLTKKISFLQIYDVIKFALQHLQFKQPKSIFQIKKINKKSRKYLTKHFILEHKI